MNDDVFNVVKMRKQLHRAVFIATWSPRIVFVAVIVMAISWWMRGDVVVYSSSYDGKVERLDGLPLTQDVVDKINARLNEDAKKPVSK